MISLKQRSSLSPEKSFKTNNYDINGKLVGISKDNYLFDQKESLNKQFSDYDKENELRCRRRCQFSHESTLSKLSELLFNKYVYNLFRKSVS